MKTAAIIFLIMSMILAAQDKNKIINDEKSNKAMLIGLCDKSVFADTSFSWWFEPEYEIYSPDPLVINKILNLKKDFTIKIIIGTWCSDSRREVPRFYKILDLIKYDQSKAILICVNRAKETTVEKYSELGIKYIPTFIVFKNGSEIGRIIESPVKKLEEDLLDILQK